MAWPRKVGVLLVTAGAVLLAIGVVPALYGAAMARMELASFHAGPRHPVRRWDSARIRAYQSALHLDFPAPEAVLRIPRLGLEAPVLEGVSPLALNRGVGHIPGTALPGQPGNVAITGHRDGFFRPLQDARIGDILELEHPRTGSEARQTDRYIVREIKVVRPAETWVLKPSGSDSLTLVTCYPFYVLGSAPRRYIVRAVRLSTGDSIVASLSSALKPTGD
jgi:sortase A